MLVLLKVAVTGGLACGKTSVCRVLAEYGACVVDADKLVHNLLSHDKAIGKKVIALLGAHVLVKGKLDRGEIARAVFSDAEKLISLESILHPALKEKIEDIYISCTKACPPPPFFVVEIPLLYEAHFDHFYDIVVAVVADENLCRSRFTAKTGCSAEEYDKRMLRQMPVTQKANLADYVLLNNGDMGLLEKNTIKLIKELSSQ